MHADSGEIGIEGPLQPLPGFIPQGLPAAALPLNCRLNRKCNFGFDLSWNSPVRPLSEHSSNHRWRHKSGCCRSSRMELPHALLEPPHDPHSDVGLTHELPACFAMSLRVAVLDWELSGRQRSILA